MLHPEDPLELDRVPYECSVAGITRIMFGLLMKMKRKMMVIDACVFFFLVTLTLNGGS